MSLPSPASRLARGRRTTTLLVTFFLVLAGGALTVPSSDAVTTSPLTISSWSTAQTEVGESGRVVGFVLGNPEKTTVRVQVLVDGVWRDQAQTTTDALGGFDVRWPLLRAGTHTHRVRVDGKTVLLSALHQITVVLRPAALTSRAVVRRPSKAVLTWRLDGEARERRVVLQRRTAHTRWRTLRGTLVAPGEHRTVVRPGSLGAYRYRLHAPATDRLAAASSTAIGYARPPGYRPRGRAHQHRSLFANGARWNPCRTITWRANLAHAWPGALQDMKEAVRRTAWASGLTFRYLGRTSVLPDGTTSQRYPSDTDLVVAWARPGTTPLLPRHDTDLLGTGGGVAWGGMVDEMGRSAAEIRTGRVVISTRATRLAPGFGTRATRGSLLMHELGHAVGLGHVGSRAQLMNPTIRPGADRWGRGDLRGLTVRGAPRGCLSPAPSSGSTSARLAPTQPESADLD